ncbi:hypothetical protein F5B22DRAFT_640549 [Xylaria bambusicola]|uniref:uncharacterized protein n=1 Tax=Xylaria bambusicola TaxID=326684 RepID=UPI00200777C1|nr:uncharacterized protein F5B22DRAFT_640549 [Xylaria bambusicola]KAI0502918.1 hypothetical protein F5B22DRAFT_640549 [Xylaria bambusicola]
MVAHRISHPEVSIEGSAPDIGDYDEIPNASENSSFRGKKDNAFSTMKAPRTEPPLSLPDLLGYGGLFGVIGGSFWILGIFGFLTFLWFGHGSRPEAADATSLWRFLALHNYFPETVTICSVALRIVVGIQATICTSMLAALMLEKHGARKTQGAWLSIMRSINDGPMKLGGILAKGPSVAFLHVETWLTFLIIIVTLALQFSSTLLLSDIDNFVILGNLNATEFGDLFSLKNGSNITLSFDNNISTRPPIYAAFGEVQAGFNATPNERGASDTGFIQRSLIPISDVNQRTSVRKLEGATMVMGSHVSCIRPHIDAKYGSFTYQWNENIHYGYIEGTVDYNASFSEAGVTSNMPCNDKDCAAVGFGCVIPGVDAKEAGWQTTACIFDGVGGRGNTSDFNFTWNPSEGLWSPNTTMALVMSTSMGYVDWSKVQDIAILPAGDPYMEWQSYDTGSGYFNITLCSFGFNLGRFRTSMVAPTPLREPQTTFDHSTTVHSTADVQNFMGVNVLQGSHAARSILDLKILGPAEDLPAPSQNFFFLGNITIGRLVSSVMESVIYDQFWASADGNTTMLLCSFCSGVASQFVHPEISLLFSDTVAETGRAANALMSLLTTWFGLAYYTYLGDLKIPYNATVLATKTVQTPRMCSINGCPGYITVSTLILTHVISVVTIAALYVVQTRYSRYGNVWHTVAQLRGDELADVLDEAHDASDATVEQNLKMQDEAQLLKVGRQSGNGRVGVIEG